MRAGGARLLSRPVSLNARHDEDPHGYDRLRTGWLNRRRAQHFHDRVEAARPGSVVEVGCGTGRMLVDLASSFPDVHFLGLEPLDEYVRFGQDLITARGLTNIKLHHASGESMDAVVGPESADLVISSDVLHHVSSLPTVIRNVRRAMRPGASWSLVEPNPGNPYVGLFQALTSGERNFWAGRFIREAAAAGLEVSHRSRLFLIPARIEQPPGWLVSLERRLERAPVLGGAVRLELVPTVGS